MKIDRRWIFNFDWFLLMLALAASTIGVGAIFSATYKSALFNQGIFLHIKQIYWIGAGICALLVMTCINYRTITRGAYLIYIFNILLLIVVLFVGKGVSRWLKIGPISFQPSEFMKLSFILVMAHYFGGQKDQRLDFGDLLAAIGLLALPLALIVKQPDLGTALALIPIFLAMIFVAGIKLRYIFGLIFSVFLCIPLAWGHLKPYQKNRILYFLWPERDPLGAGYHKIQSTIAVGSGGLFGRGFLQGTQTRLNFLPAQHTDFIFSVLSEEWGFIGAAVLLGIILLIIIRGLDTALKSKDRAGALLGAGIITAIAAHVFINAGMATGLLPITGIPFPFLSYGGSSVVYTFMEIGLLLNVRMRRFK